MRSDLIISAALHAALLVWCALSFSIAPLNATSPDSLPIDIVSDKQFTELMAGAKSAPKAETPKPLADKIDTPKPNQTQEPVPTVVEKPEIKPIPKEAPPEAKPEQKQAETKPEPKPQPKSDPIAEALKKEDAKKAAEAKKQQKQGALKKQPQFNPDEIKDLLDKRNPQRQASAGETLNKDPTLGISAGTAPALSQSEIDALRARLMQLWNPPTAFSNPDEITVTVRIKLGRDRKLASPPMVLTSGRGNLFEVARDRAVRALFDGQPFDMLKPEHYDLWREMGITFDPREMMPG
jgi:outer membrane biosynthesis protein TonB